MSIPIEIVFRHLDQSASMERFVRSRVTRLNRFQDWIIHCRIIIDAPHNCQRKGNGFQVHVEILIPGKELVVSHRTDSSRDGNDLYAAIATALKRAYRQVRSHAGKRVAHHTPLSRDLRRRLRRIDLEPYPEPEDDGAPIEAQAGLPTTLAS